LTTGHRAGTVRVVHPAEGKAASIRELLHELRTPLAALAALAPAVDETSRQTYLSVLEHLTGILEHSFGNRPMRGAGPVDLADVVADAVRLIDPAEDGKRFRVEETLGLVAHGDRVLLTQILVNLLSNAVRHSPGGVPVEIRGGRRGAEVFLRVRDHGPGVDAEVADRIFDNGASFGDHQGNGIGLALSKRLAEQMEGSLRLVEHDETTFELTLPTTDHPSA
jgi:two-component system sensor histidine kinase KdpD